MPKPKTTPKVQHDPPHGMAAGKGHLKNLGDKKAPPFKKSKDK